MSEKINQGYNQSNFNNQYQQPVNNQYQQPTMVKPPKMVCKSGEGSITIMYKDGKLTGYTAKNIEYDLEGQQKVAELMGIDAYLSSFNEWFENNTTGVCKINGETVK